MSMVGQDILAMPILFQAALGLFFALVAVMLHRRYLCSLSKVPGPWLASITRLWNAYHIWRGDHNTILLELHAKYGHFVRIAPNEVSVSHPDGPNILLQSLLRKGDWYRVFCMPDWRFVTPSSVLDPREKMQRSKSFASGFALSNLLRAEHRFDSNIVQLLAWMDRHAEDHRPMHLDRYFTFVAFDNAGEAVFSKSFGFMTKGEDVRGAIRNSRMLARYLAVAGYYIWFHRLFIANPFMTWLGMLPMGHLATTSKMALEERRANSDASSDIVAHWLKTQHEHPDRMSPRDLEAQVMVSVAAGSDTLSCALQAFIYFMIQHQDSWRRARDEIQTAQKEDRCLGTVISYHDARALPYLEACVYEAMRMFGPGPFGLPRVAPPGGIQIGDSFFEEGTVLSINPQVMQKAEDCWDNTATVWNPDRWLERGIRSRYQHWLVFGLGFNRCPGEQLALLQIFKIAATIVRDYTIHQVDPKNTWKYEAYFTVVPHSWPVYISKLGA